MGSLLAPPADPVLRASTQPSSIHRPISCLFVDGTYGSCSVPYRLERVAAALGMRGCTVEIVRTEDVATHVSNCIPDVAVFFRAPLWTPYREVADHLRSAGTLIGFDIDDFAFDETIIDEIDGVRFLQDSEMEPYRRGVRAYREFVTFADFCTTPTDYLTRAIRAIGKPAFTVRNTLSDESLSRYASVRPKTKSRPFVVGYYSGTKTHQADFRRAGDALATFMEQTDDVEFRLVGEFDLAEFPRLEALKKDGRVQTAGLMPHDEMLADQLRCDVILAPLEIGNRFCESKSELKFFEAALVGRPVIASSTGTFIKAQNYGEFGYLVETVDDWLQALRRVYRAPEHAQLIASRARSYVRQEYCAERAASEAHAAYLFMLQQRGHRSHTSEQRVSVGVAIPDVPRVSGGHRKIFTICEALEKHGYAVTLYVYSDSAPSVILKDIQRYYADISPEVRIFNGTIEPHDIFICTSWLTAYDFRKIPFSGKKLYFVQDYEPMFFPAGEGYVRAVASYQQGHEIICYGRWVATKLKEELDIKSSVIPFVLDKGTYAPSAEVTDRDIDVLVFARPSQDRRCFRLICEGLEWLHAANPQLTIGLFGEDQYPSVSFPHINFGAINGGDALAALYHRTKVGVCFSTTNPSQLGYEMIACGVVLIDIEVRFCEANFGGDAFVRYCTGTPESLQSACLDLLGNPADMLRRQALGYEFSAAMLDDSQLGEQFISAASLELHSTVYTAEQF